MLGIYYIKFPNPPTIGQWMMNVGVGLSNPLQLNKLIGAVE